ncbi:MAG: carbon starvation protein A [Verrucomicrobia bacterium]|nr:MAG: carbon starvation protein A [Verrucomicrobiota bacterium]
MAYRFYGAFLSRKFEVDDSRPTPACEINDGIDYVPTRTSVVFGHHFSSIAGAGPIVGPIIAAAAFGWGPTWLWVILGAIFVGGVHDFGATMLSIRNKGQTIIDTLRARVGEKTGKLFLCFVLVTLIYVIIVFLDLTATGYASTPAVATASGWFALMALAFGQAVKSKRLSYLGVMVTFVVLTYAGLALGHYFPAPEMDSHFWMIIILAYCLIAAVLPVDVLMQPRDFLSATFLYAIMGMGIVGACFAPVSFDLPMWVAFDSAQLGMMVPFLFITVACGACSGFHSVVASGTTSKQLLRESDARRVAYGGMIVEGLLAVFAIGCIAICGGLQGSPTATFATGAAKIFQVFGIPQKLGVEFATLAVSTFLLTSLDTCVRLARFLIEEMVQKRNAWTRYLGTLGVVALAGWLAFQEFPGTDGKQVPAWQALWPLFGATNQLLAALALMTLTVYLYARGKSLWWVTIPTGIMIVMPISALVMMILDENFTTMIRSTALVQCAIAVIIIAACVMRMRRPERAFNSSSDS